MCIYIHKYIYTHRKIYISIYIVVFITKLLSIYIIAETTEGSSVWKWSPNSRTATACETRGALHLRACALSLHAISKAGRAFYFDRGANVCHISGRSS